MGWKESEKREIAWKERERGKRDRKVKETEIGWRERERERDIGWRESEKREIGWI